MNLYIELAAAASLSLWATLALAIWKWVPGQRTWAAWCPVHKKEAKVSVVERKAAVVPACIGVKVAEVTRCSLFKGRPVNCRQECLQRP